MSKRVFYVIDLPDGVKLPSGPLYVVPESIDGAEWLDGSLPLYEIHPAAGPWQDIKDAPKDGTAVLGLDAVGDVWVMAWDGHYWAIALTDQDAKPTHFALIHPPQEVPRVS